MVDAYADLGGLEEDKRIDLIGYAVFQSPHSSADKPVVVAICVEDDAKADRYIEKLQKKFPSIRIIERLPGPANTIVVKVGPSLR